MTTTAPAYTATTEAEAAPYAVMLDELARHSRTARDLANRLATEAAEAAGKIEAGAGIHNPFHINTTAGEYAAAAAAREATATAARRLFGHDSEHFTRAGTGDDNATFDYLNTITR